MLDKAHKAEGAEAAAMISVRLPGVLVDLFPGSTRSVVMSATTVEEMMSELDRRWPGMRDRLCDSTPAIRRHINVFIDGERATLDTPIEPGTEVFVLTAISGG
jgi:molybdopterin converting factor small subunit